MQLPYLDLHTHTKLSDGLLTPPELAARARDAGIGVLAITDHNHTSDLTQLRRAFPDIRFIQGAEISCIYTAPGGRETELHVVGLGIDPADPGLRAVLAHNQPDRRPYVEAILEKLAQVGIRVGSYDDLRRRYPDTLHLGRMQIAKEMLRLGYVGAVDEAFDEYIGAFGSRRAFVPNPLRYVSLEEAVAAIRSAGGVPVLAHLYYYQLSEAEGRELVAYFASLTGSRGAMEVAYGRYDDARRAALGALAEEFGLMASAASDYHGHAEHETLDHHFPRENFRPLLEVLL